MFPQGQHLALAALCPHPIPSQGIGPLTHAAGLWAAVDFQNKTRKPHDVFSVIYLLPVHLQRACCGPISVGLFHLMPSWSSRGSQRGCKAQSQFCRTPIAPTSPGPAPTELGRDSWLQGQLGFSQRWVVRCPLLCSLYLIISSARKHAFPSSSPIWMVFISFSHAATVVGTPSKRQIEVMKVGILPLPLVLEKGVQS